MYIRFLYIASLKVYIFFIYFNNIENYETKRKKTYKKEKKKEIKEKFGFCCVFLCTYVAISDQ